MILMQRDTRLADFCFYFIAYSTMMALFLIVFFTFILEQGFWIGLLSIIIFFLLLREIKRNFVGMVRGFWVKFYIAKDEHLS